VLADSVLLFVSEELLSLLSDSKWAILEDVLDVLSGFVIDMFDHILRARSVAH
jgi:hypothetical protein